MRSKSILFLCVSVCICGLLFFYRLGDRDLWASHEARAAQNAQRIFDDGDWLLPRLFDEQVELQKPPLYYWLVAAAGWVRGGTVDAVAVRLPAAIAGLATILIVYCFLARRGRPLAGLLAAFTLATAQHFTWISRTGRIDIPLTFTVTCSTLALWTARQSDTCRPFLRNLVGYLTIAVGVMLKGPIGVVLPFAVVTVASAVNRRSPFPRSLLWGLPLIVGVAAPWFVVAHVRTHGEFTRVFYWYHHIQRATGGAAALAAHPWWFYVPRMAFDFLPWTPLLVIAGWFMARRRFSDVDQVARLGAVWLTAILLLLSLSRFKRADYLLPAYPGAAILLGCVGERLYLNWQTPKRLRWLAAGLASSMSAIVAAWVVYFHIAVPRMDAEHEQQSFAAAVRSVVPTPNLVLLFRVEDHLLSYHLGRPLNTFLEWENLDVWAGRPGSHFVLMPAECAGRWRQYISSGTLEEVLRYCDRTDRRRPRDIVLMRTRPASEGSDGPVDRATAAQQGADQHAAAGLQPGGGSGGDR
jgi:4-amino-4-deoxy-L-arabinose transferase-like glycosyltransferase